jgi:hypothetical protein
LRKTITGDQNTGAKESVEEERVLGTVKEQNTEKVS